MIATQSTDHGIVHVHLDRLDGLLNLVGELVINRATLTEVGRQARSRYGFKEQVLDLVETIEQVGRITDEIQAMVIKARMVPVGNVFNRFRNFLSDLSSNSDKEIDLVIQGAATEVDKRVIDDLAEPLVHLVRNAVDHGIETADQREKSGKPRMGRVTLDALHEANHLVIDVADDGAGVDIQKVRRAAVEGGVVTSEEVEALDDSGVIETLFHPRFSTAGEVTGMSGRGVGLDAARRRVESLGGSLTLESEAGRGCRARIRLPLTMAIIQALLVDVGGETYAVPVEHVEETVRARNEQIDTVEDREVLELRNEALSLARLSEVLEVPVEQPPEKFFVVVVRNGEHRIGLMVDRVLGRQEIVIKPLVGRLSGIKGVSGASIDGRGNVFLILDSAALCQLMINGESRSQEA